MKKVYFYALSLFCFSTMFLSCEQSEINDFPITTNQVSTKTLSLESSRMSFDNINDFIEFMDDTTNCVDNDDLLGSEFYLNSAPQLKNYLRLSPLSKVYNEDGEFQIGDTIFILGKTGYAEFLVHSNQYEDAMSYVNNESEIISNISSYDKNEQGLYVLADSIYLYYSEEPMAQIEKIETKDLMNSSRVLNYEVDVRFWTSSNFVFNGCGIEMSYKEIQNGSLKDYDTNLEMIWSNIVVNHKEKSDMALGAMIPIANGNKIDTGSYDKKTFAEKKGFNIGKYRYTLYRGTLTGKAKSSSGQWVSDSFTM